MDKTKITVLNLLIQVTTRKNTSEINFYKLEWLAFKNMHLQHNNYKLNKKIKSGKKSGLQMQFVTKLQKALPSS